MSTNDAGRRHRRQRENERGGIGGAGAVDQAELAADVARYIEHSIG
jgi:hypothetical protein